MPGAYIRGMGLKCALGESVEACLLNLEQRQVRPVNLTLPEFPEPFRIRYYRIPDQLEMFDPARFESLILPVVQAAILQAGLNQEEVRRLPAFIGSSSFTIGRSELGYADAWRRHPGQAIPMPSCGYQDLAELLNRRLNCHGESYAYNTACTASANALLAALRMIENGTYRHALVIGTELANRTTLTGFSALQLLATALQPFDHMRQGVVLGEGIGAIVLSGVAGRQAGIRVIGGSSNCDTWSLTTANINGHSAASVMRLALKQAQARPQDICAIKAHGTSTRSGDAAEARGLHQVFGQLPPLTVLKPYVGHTLGACCITELVLLASALIRGFIPETPGFKVPDPELAIYPLATSIPAPDGLYLLNHFGFAGNNTVLVLEKNAAP